MNLAMSVCSSLGRSSSDEYIALEEWQSVHRYARGETRIYALNRSHTRFCDSKRALLRSLCSQSNRTPFVSLGLVYARFCCSRRLRFPRPKAQGGSAALGQPVFIGRGVVEHKEPPLFRNVSPL